MLGKHMDPSHMCLLSEAWMSNSAMPTPTNGLIKVPYIPDGLTVANSILATHQAHLETLDAPDSSSSPPVAGNSSSPPPVAGLKTTGLEELDTAAPSLVPP